VDVKRSKVARSRNFYTSLAILKF